jgi:uncharacterized RDD family membrane protein YckC
MEFDGTSVTGSNGSRLATPQHRLGGFFLEMALVLTSFFTFGLAWIIWNLIVWGQGQTPAKQILKMRVFSTDTGKPATWGHMAIRQFLIPTAFSMASLPFTIAAFSLATDEATDISIGITFILGYAVYFVVLLIDSLWIFRNTEGRRLTDLWARTIVVNESK